MSARTKPTLGWTELPPEVQEAFKKMKRKVEFRLNCSCGLRTAWRVERKRTPAQCSAQGNTRLIHVALVEKRVSFV